MTETAAALEVGLSATLLVIEAHEDSTELAERVSSILRRTVSHGGPLDVMAMVGGVAERVRASVTDSWTGPVRWLDTAVYFQRTQDATRADLSVFVAELRGRLKDAARQAAGAAWAEAFDARWWWLEVSEKNALAAEEWRTIFRLAAVRERLVEARYDRCAFVGSAQLGQLLRQQAALLHLSYEQLATVRRPRQLWRMLVKRAVVFGCRLYAVVTVRRKAGLRRTLLTPHQREALLLVVSAFPRSWTTRAGLFQDMYYGEFPQRARDDQGMHPVYGLLLYQGADIIWPSEYRARLGQALRLAASQPSIVMESLLRPWDVLRAYGGLKALLSFWRTARSTVYARSFQWHGLDLHPVFAALMWHSVSVAWPAAELLQVQAQRAARMLAPSLVTLYFFEFVEGRALIAGFKRGSPRCPVLGMQHGPITPGKLLYDGLPSELEARSGQNGPVCMGADLYAVDGAAAERLLVGRGLPSHRVAVVGPARFDRVWRQAKEAAALPRFRGGTPRVLLAPSLHDTGPMLRFALAALAPDRRLEIVLKPHPKAPPRAVSDAVAWATEGVHDGAKIHMAWEREIYDWLGRCDILVVSYSSVGMEAIAFGIPVILTVPPDTPDMSMFADAETPVWKARTPEDLRAYIDRLMNSAEEREKYGVALERLPGDHFGRMDGEAATRLAALCRELAAATEPVP